MAIVYTKVAHLSLGNARGSIYDITLDATYAAGGYTITPASVGLADIDCCLHMGGTVDTGITANWVPATGKLQLFKGASTVTVTAGNAELTELATNETIVGTGTVLRLLLIGEAVNV